MAGEFEAIISLGGMCQTAYQIEKRFGYRINSPFDWIVAPLDSIAKILTTDGAHFGESIRVIGNGETPLCTKYGIAYQHDFPRDQQRYAMITADLMHACRSKMLHKYHKFLGMMQLNQKTLFVRLGGHHDCGFASAYVADPRPLTTADLNALCQSLSDKFPLTEFAIAVVLIKGYTKLECDPAQLDKRVKLFEITHTPGDDWIGNEAQWTPIFDSFTFNLQPGMEKACQFNGAVLQQENLHP